VTRAYIGIGSNLSNPLHQVTCACNKLNEHPDITLVDCSCWYQSVAVGPKQPDYINGAAALDTQLSAEALLDQLQNIENQQGRERSVRWGPRTLDLDILLFGDQIISTERLQVPHPCMHERNFVLQPLLDIAPTLTLPDGTSIAALLMTVGVDKLQRLP